MLRPASELRASPRPTYAHCEQLFISLPCFCPAFQCYTSRRHQPLEMNAVNNTKTRWALGVAAATASLGLFVAAASAQLAPAPKAPVAAPAAPAAPATTKAPAPAAAAKVKAEKKPASPCKGLDETACGTKTECSFTKPTKVNKATGKVQSPYCHLTPKGAVKKAAAAVKSAVTPTPPPTAPKAPAATAPVAPKAAVPKPQ